MKIIRLIKNVLNEIYSFGKHLTGAFPIEGVLTQVDALKQVLFILC
jgi:hypothetical protein